MRKKNRNSIENIKKLPQFTTMNVIDGQAGIIICSSLIFYSLTIDNILNIIVLLILAAVSIATLTGENGILTQANNAKTKTTEAQVNEEIKLAYNSVQTDSLINGWDINKKAEELQKELQKEDSSATVTVDGTNMNVSYKNYETTISEDGTIGELAKAKIIINEFKISGTKVTNPPVPTGFVHVGGTIDEGYVISDNANDVDKGADSTELLGNQFVFVPVERDQKISVKVTSEEEITSIVLTDPYGDDLTIPAVSGKEYNEEINPTINGPYRIVITTESGETKKSFLNVHSLYAIDTMNDLDYTERIAELEEYAKSEGFADLQAMIDDFTGGGVTAEDLLLMDGSNMKNYAETEDYADKVNTNGGFYIGRYEATYEGGKVASKKATSTRDSSSIELTDGMLWNFISQTDALAKAKAYNINLTSTLLTGAAWDRTLGWLYETGEKTGAEIVADSKDWGNYYDDTFSGTTDLIKTGEYEQTRAKNIYDLAGNVAEWTTESCVTTNRVRRGGYYDGYGSGGSGSPASTRDHYDPSYTVNNIGFRVTLFM